MKNILQNPTHKGIRHIPHLPAHTKVVVAPKSLCSPCVHGVQMLVTVDNVGVTLEGVVVDGASVWVGCRMWAAEERFAGVGVALEVAGLLVVIALIGRLF